MSITYVVLAVNTFITITYFYILQIQNAGRKKNCQISLIHDTIYEKGKTRTRYISLAVPVKMYQSNLFTVASQTSSSIDFHVNLQWRIPPLRTKIFLISCSLSKNLANLYGGTHLLEGWRPLLRGILDPSLACRCILYALGSV